MVAKVDAIALMAQTREIDRAVRDLNLLILRIANEEKWRLAQDCLTVINRNNINIQTQAIRIMAENIVI
jgi:hypothetical protein